MSCTRNVPPGVPSLRHGSLPLAGWAAPKNTTPAPPSVSPYGRELPRSGARFLNRPVPPGVPLLSHGSRPSAALLALNSSSEPTGTRLLGVPTLRLLVVVVSRVTDSAEYSHSSWPLAPSSARRYSPTPGAAVSRPGCESFGPGLMSAARVTD